MNDPFHRPAGLRTILVTGADGFIGKNLVVALGERAERAVVSVVRSTTDDALAQALASADAVVHLAAVNRPTDPQEFTTVNVELTDRICDLLEKAGKPVPVAFASSTQVEHDNPYGRSKLAAEQRLRAYGTKLGAPVRLFRLPGVFGKWCRPNYNSVVATFCHNAANGLPLQVHDPDRVLPLVYVDDVVAAFVDATERPSPGVALGNVSPVYETTLGRLAELIRGFAETRPKASVDEVGTGLTRALYATYVSCLRPQQFGYPLTKHEDPRGVFVEVLKTPKTGQFSFFTAHPGVTRGGHYHHTKTEKFLVVKGRARFRFRHLVTNETFELDTSGSEPFVVDTIPGWAHDITNCGDDEMVVMLWANEVFDRDHPDTVASKVST